jgi:hypothetical protein
MIPLYGNTTTFTSPCWRSTFTLSLSQPQDVAPGTPTCGPFGENGIYTRANGTIVNGTRAPFSNAIGSDGYFANMGNSN